MPASSLRKMCPSPDAPVSSSMVETLSCTEATRAPEFATKKVPGSISSFSSRPVSFANSSKATFTAPPQSWRSVDFSPCTRATLYPPPRLRVLTSLNCLQRSSESPDTFVHTSGSEPEPMWVCILTTFSPCFSAIAFTSSICLCQMPKLEDGPPTFVLLVPPLPRPGLKRTPTSAPGNFSPKVSNCLREQAFTFRPCPTRSAKSGEVSSCDDRDMHAGSMPAAMARFTSWVEEASKWRPAAAKSFKIAAFGHDFMA
mmetsp:Transcript_8789/g.11191  ORF Transcript_8789/g.11191 Transcript_8789/m.11191 type:complete len:256 (+) Transcript_8789:729-1496(+)